jgi:hypothetical protein
MDTTVVTPAIEINVVFDREGGRAFQVRFAPLPIDVQDAQLDETFNRVLRAVDRQQAYYELQDLDEQLKDKIELLRKYEGLVVTLDAQAQAEFESSGRRGDWTPDKMTPHTRTEREKITVSLQRDRATAEAMRGKIDRLRARSNGHASNGGADRSAGVR